MNNKDIIIRTAVYKDAAEIAVSHVKSWQHTYKGIIHSDYLDNIKVEDRTISWQKNLQDTQDSNTYVALYNNKGSRQL